MGAGAIGGSGAAGGGAYGGAARTVTLGVAMPVARGSASAASGASLFLGKQLREWCNRGEDKQPPVRLCIRVRMPMRNVKARAGCPASCLRPSG